MEPPSCVTIHCPRGIVEKDVLTFFSATRAHPSEEETRKALVLFHGHRRDLGRTWRDATLRIACPWGTVQFIAGHGTDVVWVNIDGQPLTSFQTSCQNLCLGFFRLLVAIATLGHVALMTLATVTTLQEEWTNEEQTANTLLALRQCLEVAVCLLVVLDTVYGPRSLLDSCRQREDVSAGPSGDVLTAHHHPKSAYLPHRPHSTDDAHDSGTQPLKQELFRHQPHLQRPSEEDQQQRQIQPADDEQLRQKNQQQGQHPQRPENGQPQTETESKKQRGAFFSCQSRAHPETGSAAAGSESNIHSRGAQTPQEPRGSHAMFQTCHCHLSHSWDGSARLLGSGSGLVRAGLYWFLASSVSSSPRVSEWYSPLGAIGSLPVVTGYALFVLGVLSAVAHVGLRLYSKWMPTPVGFRKRIKQLMAKIWRSNNVSTGESESDVSRRQDMRIDYICRSFTKVAASGNHQHMENQRRSQFPANTSRCHRVVALLTVLFPALVTLLTALVHAILLASASSLNFRRRLGGLLFFDDSTPSRQYVHDNGHLTLTQTKVTLLNAHTAANVSALTLCMYVSLWMIVTSVRTLRQRTARTSLGVTGALLYVCCVSTLWTRDVMTLFQQCFAVSRAVSLGGNWDRVGLQAGLAAVSAMVVLLPILCALFQLCSARKRRDDACVATATPSLRRTVRRLWTSGCVPRLAQAAAVTLALCALLLTFLAIPLPWVTVRTSYSRDFQPMAAILRNVSMHLERHAVAMDTLVTLPVCAEDKITALSGEMEYSKDTVSRLGVDQIEKFCLQYECTDVTAVETIAARREYPVKVDRTVQDNSNKGHLSKNGQGKVREAEGFNVDLNLHETSSDTFEKNGHRMQSNTRNKQQTRSPFCKTFCATIAYFRGSTPFNASVHKLLAREVKGMHVYESLHLKSLILEEKTNLLSKLDRKGSLGGAIEDRPDDSYDRNGDVNFLENGSDTHSHRRQHAQREESKDLGQGAAGQAGTNYGHTTNDEEDDNSSWDTSRNSQRHFQHHESSSNLHVSCMQTLCALQAVSQVGLAAPLLGLAFQAVHLAVQAMTVTLRLIMKAEELSVVFDDLKVRLESLALYLEHGVQEKVVHLDISNYSMIYLAYPALMTGCVGVLMGFWHRRGPASHCRRRRCRAMAAVVLPLMVLNVLGIGVTMMWENIVESVSSLVTLVDVTSSPQLGARCLLAAFACAFCACALFLLLIGWQERRSHPDQQGHTSGLREELAPKEQSRRSSAIKSPGKGTVGNLVARYPPSGEDAPSRTPLGQASAHEQQGVQVSASVHEQPKTARSLAGRRSPVRRTSPSLNDWHQESARLGGSRSLSAVLTLTGCGLMVASLSTPVFFLRAALRRPFETLLTQLEQDSVAVATGRHVLMSEGQGSCDVMEALGREVVVSYLSTLQELELRPLVTELRILKTKAENDTAILQPLVLTPCMATAFVALLLLLYEALAHRVFGFEPQSLWRPTPQGTARVLRRLSLLSLAWLLHTTLALVGPAASVAAPVVVEVSVGLGAGFGLAVAAHVALLLASLELRLSVITPLL